MNLELTAEERAVLASLGRFGGRVGQSRLRQSYLAQIDREQPDLPEGERQARADALYREYMRQLRAIPRGKRA